MAYQIDYYSVKQLSIKYINEFPQTLENVARVFAFINNLIHSENNRQCIIDGAYDEPGHERITDGHEQWRIYNEEIYGWQVSTLSQAQSCISSFNGYNYRFKNQFFEDMSNAIAPLSFLMGRLKDDLECNMYEELKYLENKPLDIESFIIGYYQDKLLF